MKVGIIGSRGQLGSNILNCLNKNVISIERKHSIPDSVNTLILAAGSSNSRDSETKTKLEFEDFYNFTKSINYKKMKKIYFISSGGSIYGDNSSIPLHEDSKKNPQSEYGLLKSKQETILMNQVAKSECQLIIFRLANVFSKNPKGLIKRIFDCQRDNSTFEYLVDPNSQKQYGSAEDYSKIICNIVTTVNFTNKVVIRNLYSPFVYSVKEICDIFQKKQYFSVSPLRLNLPQQTIILTSNYNDILDNSLMWSKIESYYEDLSKIAKS